jgi:TRAP-type C4-dicarboxylate transport system substrate-binding protein
VKTLAALLLAAGVAHADPQVLRLATVAPDGTSWARDLKAFAHAVEDGSHGAVRIKLILGGIAGDEDQLLSRLQRGQLDGVVSGGLLCQQLAPSLGVLGVVGLVQERSEAAYVAGKLKPIIDEEAARAGYTIVATAGVGPLMVFSKTPIDSMADLRARKIWAWNAANQSGRAQWAEMGLHMVPLRLDEGAAAYQDGRVDAFLTTPTAALAYQWSTLAKYLSRVRFAFLTGCLVLANRSVDPLPTSAKSALRTAAAELQARFEESGRRGDDQLLGGLFQKQGLTVSPVSESFRSEFFALARQMRDRMGDRAVSHELVTRVLTWLADFRAESGR